MIGRSGAPFERRPLIYPTGSTNRVMPASVSENIDVARGIAALGVIWAHAMSVHTPLTLNGAFWVWVFFATSGYLQGRSFASGRYRPNPQGAGRFWKNRALRILPLFWLVLTLALVARLSLSGEAIGSVMVVRQYLTLTTDYQLLGPLWSISTEIHLYIMTPFFCALLAPRMDRRAVAILLGFGVCAFILAMQLGDHVLQPRSAFGNAIVFLSGILTAHLQGEPRRISRRKRNTLFAVGVLTAGIFEHLSPTLFWTLKGGTIIAIALALLVVSFPSIESREERPGLPKLMLAFVGRYCYGVYVYAALLQLIVGLLFGVHTGVIALAAGLCGLPAAMLSYRLFEQRFAKRRAPWMASDAADFGRAAA